MKRKEKKEEKKPRPLQFYSQNIFRVFPEYFHTTENISILWNWAKLWKMDFPTFFYNISKIFSYYGRSPVFSGKSWILFHNCVVYLHCKCKMNQNLNHLCNMISCHSEPNYQPPQTPVNKLLMYKILTDQSQLYIKVSCRHVQSRLSQWKLLQFIPYNCKSALPDTQSYIWRKMYHSSYSQRFSVVTWPQVTHFNFK